MYEIPFNQSEEAFLLTCVQEVIKVWSSQGQANLNLSVQDGLAAVHLGFHLGDPRQAHVHVQQPSQPQPHKFKSPAKKEKDRARAAAHQAKLKNSVLTDLSAAQDATTQTLPIPTSIAASASALPT